MKREEMQKKLDRAELIAVVTLLGFLLVGFTVGVSVVKAESLRFSKGELACFDTVDANDFVAPVIEPRFRKLRGYRQCKPRKFKTKTDWFNCLVDRARPSRKVMQVVEIKNLPESLAYGNWGNLGWARENVFAIPSMDTHFENATLIARGVEWDEIVEGAASWIIEFALEDHDDLAWEAKCVRRTKWCRRGKKQGRLKVCFGSFNERQPIPDGSKYSVDWSRE